MIFVCIFFENFIFQTLYKEFEKYIWYNFSWHWISSNIICYGWDLIQFDIISLGLIDFYKILKWLGHVWNLSFKNLKDIKLSTKFYLKNIFVMIPKLIDIAY
jgi:hypothetical protein